MCTPSFLVCARITTRVCLHTAQLRGNIGCHISVHLVNIAYAAKVGLFLYLYSEM